MHNLVDPVPYTVWGVVWLFWACMLIILYQLEITNTCKVRLWQCDAISWTRCINSYHALLLVDMDCTCMREYILECTCTVLVSLPWEHVLNKINKFTPYRFSSENFSWFNTIDEIFLTIHYFWIMVSSQLSFNIIIESLQSLFKPGTCWPGAGTCLISRNWFCPQNVCVCGSACVCMHTCTYVCVLLQKVRK